MVMIVTIIATLFGLFTTCMLFDQLGSVTEGVTGAAAPPPRDAPAHARAFYDAPGAAR